MKRLNIISLSLLSLSACSERLCIDGGAQCWAGRTEIIEAAAKCGVPNFEPTEAGDAWAAYVPKTVPNHEAKEQCIYDHFKRLGLLVTR